MEQEILILLAGAGGFLGALGIVLKYISARLAKLEKERDIRQKADIDSLRKENARLLGLITGLEDQTKQIPALREQLRQAEDQQRESMRLLTSLNERFTKAEKALEAANNDLECEREKNAGLMLENTNLRRDVERLGIEKAAYQDALKLIGLQVKPAEPVATKSESAEPAPDKSESSPAGEVVSEGKPDDSK